MPGPKSKERETPDSLHGELLTPLQAADHLGITAELLFAYTAGRAKAKPCRLATSEVNGETRFKRVVLDDFDRYLGEPWAPEGAARNSVPKCIENHLRAESNNQCTRCGSGMGVDTAHIDAWTKSRSHHHHNLIRLCKSCHQEFDLHKSVSADEVRAIKDRAIVRTREVLRNRMIPIAARFQPPLPEGILEGRTEELESLRDALRSSRTVLVHGPGGIGKTQLLLHALRTVETGRRVVWVEVEQAASTEAIHAALQVMRSNGTEPATRTTLRHWLDELSACVVLDGVEQVNGPMIEEVDDLLDELKNSTLNAQFVVTSQVDLQRTVFDERLELTGLAREPSRNVLLSALRDDTPIDIDSEKSLLAFVDGHPLTLRLAAKLADYLGSVRTASVLIEQQGAAVVEIQKRTTHDRNTSLDASLSLAYENLSGVEQRILYLIASCPGGIMTRLLELTDLGGSEAPVLLAALRRWSLVQTKGKGEWDERSHMLSPIRSYVRQRWSEEHAVEAHAFIQMLVEKFSIMAAKVELDSGSDVSKMLSLFSRELPNLLLVVDEAEANLGNAEFSFKASTICYALMRFFFVLRLPEQGCEVMRRGARIAHRDGDGKRASGHIAMMVSLAQRSADMGILAEAEAMLEEISLEDAVTRGNVALTYAMLASFRGDEDATEQYSRVAITHFEAVRDVLTRSFGTEEEQAEREEISNNLSGSFQKLGDGLLGQNRVAEARAAYEKSLELLCGNAVAVNEGQILHQIGNCLSHMGDYMGAADVYGRAADQFHQINMREYLSNALAGWGYAVLEVEDETSLPRSLPTAVLGDGLEDVTEGVVSCFAAPFGLDQKTCHLEIGKLFGVIIALSFSDMALKLGPVSQTLSSLVVGSQAEAAVGRDEDQTDKYAWGQLEALIKLMSSIATFENSVTERDRVREDDTMDLTVSCGFMVMWGDTRVYAWDWLEVYLRRKWSRLE